MLGFPNSILMPCEVDQCLSSWGPPGPDGMSASFVGQRRAWRFACHWYSRAMAGEGRGLRAACAAPVMGRVLPAQLYDDGEAFPPRRAAPISAPVEQLCIRLLPVCLQVPFCQCRIDLTSLPYSFRQLSLAAMSQSVD